MIVFDGPSSIPGQQARVGQVVVLNHPANFGSVMQFDAGNWGGFSGFKSIFTNISIREATNHQMQKTLGNRLYLDVFGDDIGALQLTGLAFHGNCSDGLARNDRIGISYVLEYYRKNKLARRAAPIRVTIDPNTGYQGYLHTIQAEMFGEQHNAARLYQFSLALIILSPDTV